jgi:hypothetical protein
MRNKKVIITIVSVTAFAVVAALGIMWAVNEDNSRNLPHSTTTDGGLTSAPSSPSEPSDPNNPSNPTDGTGSTTIPPVITDSSGQTVAPPATGTGTAVGTTANNATANNAATTSAATQPPVIDAILGTGVSYFVRGQDIVIVASDGFDKDESLLLEWTVTATDGITNMKRVGILQSRKALMPAVFSFRTGILAATYLFNIDIEEDEPLFKFEVTGKGTVTLTDEKRDHNDEIEREATFRININIG